MAKNKDKRKDKTIPTLDDVVLKKVQKEDAAPVVPEDKTTEQKETSKETKPEPAEKPVDEKPVDKKQDTEDQKIVDQKEETITSTVDTKAETQETSRRLGDRRVEDIPLHSGESDRRKSQRREAGSRTTDREINAQLNPLIEKILKEMIPDLEEHIETKLNAGIKNIVSSIMPELQQHMRMQLRFEIDKHMSKFIASMLNPEDED